jgi:hypothetical protein
MKVDDVGVRTFISDSLGLWRVAATVEAGKPPIVAVIRTRDGTIVWVERSSGQAALPFRWLVRWRGAGDAPSGPHEERPRGCTSLVSLLNAIRGALGVDRGSAVRIAAAPADE